MDGQLWYYCLGVLKTHPEEAHMGKTTKVTLKHSGNMVKLHL